MTQNKIFDSNEVKMNWVGDWAKMRADIDGDGTAVYDFNQDGRFSFSDMNRRANVLANMMLNDFKLSVGDTICVLCKNRIEFIDLFFACGKIGIVLAPVSFHADREVVLQQIEDIKPAIFFYEGIFTQFTEELNLGLTEENQVCIDSFSQLYAKARLSQEYAAEISTPLALNDIAMLIATGGASGTPKICKISYRQIIWNIFEVISYGYWAENNKELVLFPLYHLGGWNSFLTAFIYGRETVLISEFYSKSVCQVVEQENITHFGGVNIMLDFIQKDEMFEQTRFEKMNGITLAGAPCDIKLIESFFDRGIAVAQAYGLTEAGPSNFSNSGFGGTLEDLKQKANSVGYPMLYCDYKISGSAQNPEVKVGDKGVMTLRSFHNYSGYLGDETLTKMAINKDGWVNTSDIASRNLDNTVRIHGRLDSTAEIFTDGGLPVNYDSIKMDWVGNTIGKRAIIAPNEESLLEVETNERATLFALNTKANMVARYLSENEGVILNKSIAIQASVEKQFIVFLATAKIGIALEIIKEDASEIKSSHIITDKNNVNYSNDVKVISYEHLIENQDSTTTDFAKPKAINSVALIVDDTEVTFRDLYWSSFRLFTFANISPLDSFVIFTDNLSISGWSFAHALINSGVNVSIINQSRLEAGKLLDIDSDYIFIDDSIDKGIAQALISERKYKQIFTNNANLQLNDISNPVCQVVSGNGTGIAGFITNNYVSNAQVSFPYTDYESKNDKGIISISSTNIESYNQTPIIVNLD